jgi:signal transduction histidine kinase
MRTQAPRPSILLVDDVEANLIALEAQLSGLDCERVRASSGNEALRQLLKRDFAVMLLDVQMPGMDGFEVARYARENPATRQVPIIFLTAMVETAEYVRRGYGTGAVDFLFKPVNAQILLSKVKVFLELYVSRQKLSQEVEAHRRTLAQLEAFNYSVSHDLRAPLRSVDGFSQALLEDFADTLDPKAKDYLSRVRAAAKRMSQIIDDLLRLSRISRAPISREPVDLSAIAETVIAELRRGEPDRQVEFTCAPHVLGQGDPGLLRIALENLLRNAWKFSNKKAKPKVEFGKRAEAEKTVYFVRDNGVGFDPSLSHKLFQPFQRLHVGQDFEGTGIGLAMVRQIIEHHGGHVWVEAEADQGATFFFWLGA